MAKRRIQRSDKLDFEPFFWRELWADPAWLAMEFHARWTWVAVLSLSWLQDSMSDHWCGDRESLARQLGAPQDAVNHFLSEASRTGVCDIIWASDSAVDNSNGCPCCQTMSRPVTKIPFEFALVSRRRRKQRITREKNRIRKRRERSHANVHAESRGRDRDISKEIPPNPPKGGRPESTKRSSEKGNGALSWNVLQAMPDSLLMATAERYGVTTRGKEKAELVKAILAKAKEEA